MVVVVESEGGFLGTTEACLIFQETWSAPSEVVNVPECPS